MTIKRTLRERKFIKAYIENSGNATQAYMIINPEIKKESARELGYRMLTKVDISMNEIMELMGTTDAYLNEILNEGLKATKVVSVIPIKPKEAQPSTGDLPDANSKNIEFVDVEDFAVRHKYLEMAYKLKNKYPTEKKNIDLNVQGSLEVNSELDKKLAQLDLPELKKLAKLSIKANAVKE